LEIEVTNALRDRNVIGSLALLLALAIAPAGTQAQEQAKYPDWSGQWRRQGNGLQWDTGKPPGRGQQAPLTPEYQAIFEASLAGQAEGGQGNDPRYSCLPQGMPRVMSVLFPMEIIIAPKTTYILFENHLPRRIYTDGRDWPKDLEPTFVGYSIGTWIDRDHDGRYDALTVETRNIRGPRTFEPSGLPLHKDNQTVVKELIYRDKADHALLHDDVTTIDNALTRPWTVTQNFRHERQEIWVDNTCAENNRHVVIGDEHYFLSGDGKLMPVRKNQPAPDLTYFERTRK
jgi:hypothetical protein